MEETEQQPLLEIEDEQSNSAGEYRNIPIEMNSKVLKIVFS